VVKKAKNAKKAAKRKKTKTAKRRARKPSARDQKILERMHETGNFPQALEALLSINLEIDRTTQGDPSPRFGETAARTAIAKAAFEDAMMKSDDLDGWISAARKAARLQD
jgi:hypothetical protein